MVKRKSIHRTNANDKADVANDKTVTSIFDNKFCIPFDIEILESHVPFYQYGLGSRLTYELTFAGYSDVIKESGSDADASYTISNISLEFDTVFYTIEFLDPVLFNSINLIQVFQWILTVRRRVLTLTALGVVFHPLPLEVFWLITSEIESFSTRNFVSFPNIKYRIRTK